MPTARNHFLTAAVGDKIYAIGGRLGSTFITRSSNTEVNEEYDVAQDVWRTRAAMPTARSGVAGGINNGNIYVAGGEFQNDKIMAAFRAFEATIRPPTPGTEACHACASRGTDSRGR